MTLRHLIGRGLSCFLAEDYCASLTGDLSEERARRVAIDGPRRAASWYRAEICRSLAAAARLRLAEAARSAPWRIAIGAYVLVAVLEVPMRWLLARGWPETGERQICPS